jgi:hypothetical protein
MVDLDTVDRGSFFKKQRHTWGDAERCHAELVSASDGITKL